MAGELFIYGKYKKCLSLAKFTACLRYISQQTLKSIALRLKPSEEANAWLELYWDDGIHKRLSQCNLRTARLLYDIQTLFDNDNQDQRWLLDLLRLTKEAILVDLEYQKWSNSTSGIWLPRTVLSPRSSTVQSPKNEAAREPLTYPRHICAIGKTFAEEQEVHYVYHDVYVASIWNIYRGCRIHLSEVLLRCNTFLESHQLASETIHASCIANISKLVSDICSTVGFSIGDIDFVGKKVTTGGREPIRGFLIYWSLYTAMASAEFGSEREAWLRTKLEFVSNVMGLHFAHVLAVKGRRDPWDLRSAWGVGVLRSENKES
jgi:hypothetical protein